MVNYSNPFLTSFLGSRNQFTQPQNQFTQQNQYDFSGWGDRLGKIEEGIASLTDQFNSFQNPGDVAPEYTGNAAPEPLEQSANAPEPLGGIESLVAEPTPAPTPMAPTPTTPTAPTPAAPMGGQTPSPFGGGLGRQMIPYQPGQEGFTPLTAEQFASQQDLFGQRQDYTDFSNMAAGITGIDNTGRYKGGANPAFGHAYEAWQGADQSQGMENWMQNYNFDLAPTMPEFNAQPFNLGEGNPPLGQFMQAQQDFMNTPEYQEWQQREEGRGPLSQSTIQAMGGMQHTGGPDIDPFISMGIGSPTATPTYEGYMDMVNQQAANYVPQSTTTSPNVASPGAGIQQQIGLAGLVNNRPNLQKPHTGIARPDPEWLAGLGALQRPNDLMQPIGGLTQPQQQQALQGGLGALQGPTQQKIQQGYTV